MYEEESTATFHRCCSSVSRCSFNKALNLVVQTAKLKRPLVKSIQAMSLGSQHLGTTKWGNRKLIIRASSSHWCWIYRLLHWLYAWEKQTEKRGRK